MLKRLTSIGLLLFFVLSVVFLTPSMAQAQITVPSDQILNPTVPTQIQTLKQSVDADTPNLGLLTNGLVDSQLAKTACVLNSAGCSDNKQAGVLQSVVSYVDFIYSNPPASGKTYVADVIQNLKSGGAQQAYAQGIGFSALNPILSVWKIMRNISYFFFVIALIVIGILIMLRQRVGSQAAITAQQAIPSIIIALITVTFSYAIAGLLIDGMYLIMFLIAGLFNKVPLINGNVFQMTGRLVFGGAVDGSAQKIGELIQSGLGNNVFADIAGFITGIGAYVIILVVIVFNTFKLFFALLGVYVELIINIAFSPVILMTGAIPGQNPFGAWLKNIVGNLAVFPVILLLIIMFDVIKDSISGTAGGFIPPYVAGYASSSVLPFLAGLGLLLALPQAVDETKKAFGVQKAGFFGNLVQAGLKNFNDNKKYGIAAGGVIAGAGLGAIGGGAVATFNAARAPEGERGKVFRRDMGRALIGGAAGGAVVGGVPQMVAKPFSMLANFERDLDSLSQTRDRLKRFRKGYSEASEGETRTAGASPTAGPKPEDDVSRA